MTQAPVAAMLTVVMPMFSLARGLSLSPFRREWLVKDIVAGIMLTTRLVPQGMAYAELAGLPPASIIAWVALLGLSAIFATVFAALGRAVPGAAGYAAAGPRG